MKVFFAVILTIIGIALIASFWPYIVGFFFLMVLFGMGSRRDCCTVTVRCRH